MFAGYSKGTIVGRFQSQVSETRIDIDRYKILGYPSIRQAPTSLRKVTARNFNELVDRLCKRVRPLYFAGRTSAPEGWEHYLNPDKNLCGKNAD